VRWRRGEVAVAVGREGVKEREVGRRRRVGRRAEVRARTFIVEWRC